MCLCPSVGTLDARFRGHDKLSLRLKARDSTIPERDVNHEYGKAHGNTRRDGKRRIDVGPGLRALRTGNHIGLPLLLPGFPRMKLAMNFLEPRASYVGINLRGRDIGMAEHRLHGTEIGAAFEKVGGEGMA